MIYTELGHRGNGSSAQKMWYMMMVHQLDSAFISPTGHADSISAVYRPTGGQE